MTQTVLSNDMVAHVWAAQTQREGRSHNGNFYFRGRALYSYGSHYPVGIFAGEGGPVFLNSTSSSVTTNGKHRGPARWAVRHLQTFDMPELDELADVIERAAGNGGVIPRPADMIEGAAEHHARAVSAYLAKHWQSIPADSEGAAWIMRAVRMGGTWAGLRARLAGKAAKDGKAALARMKAASVAEGRELAARPWPVLKAQAWAGANQFGQRGLSELIKDLRESRLATPKAHKRLRAELWRREKALRAIAETARADADRHGNPGERTKARALIGRLRQFKAGALGAVPGSYGMADGPDKLAAALALPTGAGWRMLADMLRDAARLPVHVPTSLRAKALGELWALANDTATAAEGEERQRSEVREARRRCQTELTAFNRNRRAYRACVASGAWAGELLAADWPGEPARAMSDTQRARMLDSMLSRLPQPEPWGTERGFAINPRLAARWARVAARGAEIEADLAPVREALRTAAEIEERARRAAEAAAYAERQRIEREELARFQRMPESEQLAAYAEGADLPRPILSALSAKRGPLLRARGAEVDGCNVAAGTLVTSQGAEVPLRHAFRVFQFVALCRAERKAWRPGTWGPRSIRVGHFRVDHVAASGDFEAGCHSIRWAEVSRLAEALGVSDCLATLAEIAGEMEPA